VVQMPDVRSAPEADIPGADHRVAGPPEQATSIASS
jgi:hypothetical protein